MNKEIITHYAAKPIPQLGRPYVITAAFELDGKICGEVFPLVGKDKFSWTKAERLSYDPKGQEQFMLDIARMDGLVLELAEAILNDYVYEKATQLGQPSLASANVTLTEKPLPPFDLRYLERVLPDQFLNYVISHSHCEGLKRQLKGIRDFRANLAITPLDSLE
jgi:hypothetical protein